MPTLDRRIETRVILMLAIVVAILRLLADFNIPGLGDVIVPQQLTIGIIAVAAIALLVYDRKIRINIALALFCLAGGVSLAANSDKDIPQGIERLMYFVLMLVLLSPLVESNTLRRWRWTLWSVWMWCLRAGASISATLFPIWLINGKSDAFEGCFEFRMLNGIICAIVFIDTVWRAIKPGTGRNLRIVLAVAAAYLALMLVGSSSRCSILGCICGCIPLFIRIRHDKRRLYTAVLWVSAVAVCIWVLSPKLTSGIMVKQNFAVEHQSVTASRDYMWEQRIAEFSNNPVFGNGFTNSEAYPEIQEKSYFSVKEPGSSWLSLLANTGIFGTAIFLWFVILLSKKLIDRFKSHSRDVWLYCGLLTTLLINGCFEGWLLYAGSPIFFTFWLLTSMIMQPPLNEE